MRPATLILLLIFFPTSLLGQSCERSYDEFDQAEEIDCSPVEAEYLKDNRRPLPKAWAYWRQKSGTYAIALQIYAETRDVLRLIRADKAQLIVDEWRGSLRVDPEHDGYVYVFLPLETELLQRVAKADTMKVRVAGWPFDISGVTDQVARLLEMTKNASFTSVRNQNEKDSVTLKESSAPYNIEGLNREPEFAPLPAYTEKINAHVRVRITVNPEGRIVHRIPISEGDPDLEAAVMDALQRWRFNPLPPNVPQQNQTGTITFTFEME